VFFRTDVEILAEERKSTATTRSRAQF